MYALKSLFPSDQKFWESVLFHPKDKQIFMYQDFYCSIICDFQNTGN